MATKVPAISLSDALGLGRLAADGAVGITGLVEDMHKRILETPGLAPIAQVVTGGVTRLVYRGVRGAFRLTGKGFGGAAALVGDTPTIGRCRAGGRSRSPFSTASSATISPKPAIRSR